MHALISVSNISFGFNLFKFFAMRMSAFFFAKSSPVGLPIVTSIHSFPNVILFFRIFNEFVLG